MNTPSFIRNDLIRVVYTGQVGWLREVHRTDIGYVYGIRVKASPGRIMEVPEDELTLLQLARPASRSHHVHSVGMIKFRYFVEFSGHPSVHD
jgi:hypothetical protein